MFDVKTDTGVATAHIDGKYIDAARVNDLAGLEFSVDRMHMWDAPRGERRADAVVTLDCTPATLLQIATVILDKLDLPAFNARDWQIVAEALRGTHILGTSDERAAMADKIDAAANKIAAL